MKHNFNEIVDFTGTACKPFDGEKDYVSTGCVHENLISTQEVETVNFKTKPSRANLQVRAGDIIFAKMQGTKKTLRIDDSLSNKIFSTGFCAVKPKGGIITNECLYYLLNSSLFLKEKDKNCSGATQKAITNAGLKNIELNIPDLNLQKNIEKQLRCLTKMIEIKQKQILDLDNLIKARFVEMFESQNMNTKTIEGVSLFCSRGKSPKYVLKSKLRVINQACVYWDKIKFENIKYNDDSYDGDRILLDNDLLICSTGTGTLGRCNIFHSPDDWRYMADSHVTIIRLNNYILPEVFKVWFERPMTQEKLYSDCVNGSTNQIELSKEKLKNMVIPVPSIALQKQFSIFVAQVDKSKFAIQKSLEQTQLLFDSLMQKYFG